MPGLLFQWLACSRDDAVSDVAVSGNALLQSGGGSRDTWAPLPSPAHRSERYAITQMDQQAIVREELQMLRREYEEMRDQLEKESRLAQSRARVALRIHAREQGLQRNVQVALERAKRAEEGARRMRLENAVLRELCVETMGVTHDQLRETLANKVSEREASQAASSRDTPEERRARWIRLNRNQGLGKTAGEKGERSSDDAGAPKPSPKVGKSTAKKSSHMKDGSRSALEDISNANGRFRGGGDSVTLVI